MPTLEKLLSDLKTQFESHQNPIEYYKESIQAQIRYYRWATEPQVHLALLQIERARLAKGKIYEEAQDETHIRLGYDAEDQIIFEERTVHSSSGSYQKFIQHNTDSSSVFHFKQGKLEGLAYLKRKAGLADHFVSYSPGVVNTAEYYFFENDRLQRIQTLNNYDAFKQAPQHPLYHIEYDALGAIELISRTDQPSDFFPNGQQVNIYKKNKYSLKALSDIFLNESFGFIEDQFLSNQAVVGDYLAIVLHNAFNGEQWLPFQIHVVKQKTPLNKNIELTDYLDFSKLVPPDSSSYPLKLVEVSNLLMQEIALKEKYELPSKLLEILGKMVIKARSTSETGTHLKIIVLDLPDDFHEPALGVLRRIYSAKACKTFLQK